MRALREILEVTSDTITVTVPSAFRNHKVEIIVLPLDEETAVGAAGQGWPQDFIARFSGCMPDFPDIPPEGAYEHRQPL
jgi:hypothetical protein